MKQNHCEIQGMGNFQTVHPKNMQTFHYQKVQTMRLQ